VLLSRRELLRNLPVVAAGSLLSGCGLWGPPATQIQVLRGAIPPQLIGRFRRQLKGARINLSPISIPEASFDLLRAWANPKPGTLLSSLWPLGRQPERATIAQLGDAWLTQAIVEGLISPLDPQAWADWSKLPPQWQTLVRRDDRGQPSTSGKIWAAPYRWGSTAIIYRRDKLAEAFPNGIQDWDDLLRPELTGRLSALDHPREIIGLGLKALGNSYANPNPASVAGLTAWLSRFQRQVRFYSNDNYLQPLLLGEVWAAVAWSTDALPLLRQNRQLAMVVPRSGTALWADLWVSPRASAAAKPQSAKPQSAKPQPAKPQAAAPDTANRWINHFWDPEAAAMLTQSGRATSPIVTGQEPWLSNLKDRSVLVPPAEVLAKSEFLLPLDGAAIDRYEKLWRLMRRGELS
jgi:putative spermidine/putrescine transport system substrate-binding protein